MVVVAKDLLSKVTPDMGTGPGDALRWGGGVCISAASTEPVAFFALRSAVYFDHCWAPEKRSRESMDSNYDQ